MARCRQFGVLLRGDDRRPIELAKLKRDELLPGLALGQRLAGAGQVVPDSSPAFERRSRRIGQPTKPTEGVYDVQMRNRVQERMVLVLPVKFDQPARQIPECASRRQFTVDVGAAAALRSDLAPDEKLFSARLEDRLDCGDILAGANEVAGGAAPEQKSDGFDENRLAGTGFSGEHVESRLELNVHGVNNGEAFDAEKAQHGGKRARSSIVT